MLKLLGIVLIVGASTALGFSARQQLARRVSVLTQMIRALDIMAAEVESRQTPLPEIILQLTTEGGEDSRQFFTELYARLSSGDGLSFSYRWQTTARDLAEELGMETEETDILRDAAAYLGRYQTEQQLFGLQQTRMRLETVCKQAGEVLQTKGSVYRACGIAAGVVTVLIML